MLDQSSNPRRTVRLTVRDRGGGQVVFVPAQWRDVRAVLDALHLHAERVSALVDREAARVLDPVGGGDGSTHAPELYRPPSRSSGGSRMGGRRF